MHSFVFILLGLKVVSEIIFGVNTTFNAFYTEAWYSRDSILLVMRNIAILTFILSQWIFVYQYLKVAILMPFIL